MKSFHPFRITLSFALVLSGLLFSVESSAEDKDDRQISLAGGKLSMTAPKIWLKKKPRTRIVDFEFAAPAVKGDTIDGRITIMGAGGGVEANIARWRSQFSNSGGKTDKKNSTVKKIDVAKQEVHLVDLSGDFKDRRGPFGPAELRKDFRMLGAIIVTEKVGQYFVKLYGPQATVAANKKAFQEMIDSLKVN